MNRIATRRNRFRSAVVASLLGAIVMAALSTSAQPELLYKNDFEKAELGKLSDEFQVLDGGFTVKSVETNKFLDLPGSPLDIFAVQFGPAETSNVAVVARIYGTAKGRRFPTFGVGLNGVAGYRLQISPGKKVLELYRDQEVRSSAPCEWKSEDWTWFRLQVRRVGSAWKIEGKAWPRGAAEPADWLVTAEDQEEPPAGRASIFGSPFSGTPIQFDDFIVSRVP